MVVGIVGRGLDILGAMDLSHAARAQYSHQVEPSRDVLHTHRDSLRVRVLG